MLVGVSKTRFFIITTGGFIYLQSKNNIVVRFDSWGLDVILTTTYFKIVFLV